MNSVSDRNLSPSLYALSWDVEGVGIGGGILQIPPVIVDLPLPDFKPTNWDNKNNHLFKF